LNASTAIGCPAADMASAYWSDGKLKIALIGLGAISRHVLTVLGRVAPDVKVAAIGLRPDEVPMVEVPGAAVIVDPEALRNVDAEIVVEAASREAVTMWGEAALRYARTFIVSSASALADEATFRRMHDLAVAHGSRLLVSSGAVAGIDGLAAVSHAGVDRLRHQIIKSPSAWRGTPAEGLLGNAGLTVPVSFFRGTARQAGSDYPANANVAVVTAKASGVGLDGAEIELVADPSATENRHRIQAGGAFGSMSIELHNKPLKDNPKSSQLAALSLVRMIVAQTPGIRF
jgi:aspartate dehydrogenase